jgi:tripartite-type tricarboxylate transporter receptor subunit TctC
MAASAVSFPAVRAQGSDHPIRLIVGAPAGGGGDVLARVVADGMNMAGSGARVIIENRVGAMGVIAAQLVAKAPPDGRTLLFGTSATHGTNPVVWDKLPYDPVKDFEPVTAVANAAFNIIVRADAPWKTVQDLIAAAKKNPGKLNYGTTLGGGNNLTGELFKLKTGTNITAVAYQGAAQWLVDVVSGVIDLAFDSTPSSLPLYRGGRIRVLAIADDKRSPLMPDVPSAIEAGVPGFISSFMTGILAPAKTPLAIVKELNERAVAGLKLPASRQRFESLGAEEASSTPEEYARRIAQEIKKWRELVAAGVKFVAPNR